MHSFILCAFGVTQVGKFKKHYVPTGPEASNIKGIDKNKCPQLLGKKKMQVTKTLPKMWTVVISCHGIQAVFHFYFVLLCIVWSFYSVCTLYLWEKIKLFSWQGGSYLDFIFSYIILNAYSTKFPLTHLLSSRIKRFSGAAPDRNNWSWEKSLPWAWQKC